MSKTEFINVLIDDDEDEISGIYCNECVKTLEYNEDRFTLKRWSVQRVANQSFYIVQDNTLVVQLEHGHTCDECHVEVVLFDEDVEWPSLENPNRQYPKMPDNWVEIFKMDDALQELDPNSDEYKKLNAILQGEISKGSL